MITHERLKELIEQESGCYVLNDYITGYIHLKPKYEPETWENGVGHYILYIYCDDKKKYKEEIFSEQLFETEEEAEWHKEFGCIERTERLELPTWEEINSKLTQNSSITFFEDKKHLGFITPLKVIVINNYDTWTPNHLFLEPLTKENYTLACRKAKELFLGESE